MSEMKDIEAVITQALSLMIQKRTIAEQDGAWDVQRDLESRCIFLDNLLRDFSARKSGFVPTKTVFVSYNVHSGQGYFESLQTSLKGAGFEVTTGFKRAPGDGGVVLNRVMSQLERSAVYLGLLTKEARVKRPRAREQWSPSAWTMEEKGMALAMGKPVVLLVEEGIHDDYWKTMSDKVHLRFTKENFPQKVLEAVEVVKDRYAELIVKYEDSGDLLRTFRRVLYHHES